MYNGNQMYNNGQQFNNQKKKSNNKIIIIIIAIAILVILVGGFIIFNSNINNSNNNSNEVKEEEKKEEKVSNSNEEEESIESEEEEKEPEVNYEIEDIYPALEESLKSSDPLEVGIALWDYTVAVAKHDDSVWQRYIDNETQENICKITEDDIKKRFTKDFKASNATNNNIELNEFVGNCNSYPNEQDQTYIDTTFEVKTANNKQIILKAKSTYCESYGCETKKVAKTVVKDFVIKKVNGSWLVAGFYMPY